jgi:hypothetical protein
MFRPEVRVAVHHHTRLPAAQVLQLVGRRSRLPMPRGPGMPHKSWKRKSVSSARFTASKTSTASRFNGTPRGVPFVAGGTFGIGFANYGSATAVFQVRSGETADPRHIHRQDHPARSQVERVILQTLGIDAYSRSECKPPAARTRSGLKLRNFFILGSPSRAVRSGRRRGRPASTSEPRWRRRAGRLPRTPGRRAAGRRGRASTRTHAREPGDLVEKPRGDGVALDPVLRHNVRHPQPVPGRCPRTRRVLPARSR